MKKATLTGLIYSTLTPLNVWVGYELGIENYKTAIPLVIIVMTIEFINTRLWIEAQTEEINTNKQQS